MKRWLLLIPMLTVLFPLFSQSNFYKSYDIGGDDYGNSVIGSTSGIYVAGSTSKAGAGSYDAMLMKLDSTGGVQWQTQFGGTEFEAGWAVTHFHGGFLVAGTSNSVSSSHKSDIMISLVDSFGVYQGSAYFGFDSLDENAFDVTTVGDTDLLITGQTKAN